MLDSTEESGSIHTKLFAQLLNDHLGKINLRGGAYSVFINQYFPNEVITMLSSRAAEKMDLTQSDLKEHSFCASQIPVSYWVCTIPYSVIDGKDWFGKAYGGYSKLLERAWNSDHFRGPGCKVLVHIVYGCEKKESWGNAWVNVTIFPVGSQEFGIKPVLPVDLLTEAEKTL